MKLILTTPCLLVLLSFSVITFSACPDDDGRGFADVDLFGVDGGPVDVAPSSDAAVGINCFDLAETLDIPFAIPGSFSDQSPTWTRPDGATCPADGSFATPVPFEAVSFCNGLEVATDFRFEMLRDEDDMTPFLVLYSGGVIPEDPEQCGAIQQGLLDGAELIITMQPGDQLVLVATVEEPVEGGYTIVAGPNDLED